MALPPPLQQIVDFVRAGYPDGVPERDYLPILALLGRELSDVDADEADVERVRTTLESAGWKSTTPSTTPSTTASTTPPPSAGAARSPHA